MKKITILLFLTIIYSSSLFAQPNCVTVKGYLAGATEEIFDKAVKLLTKKDYVALQKYIESGLVIMMDGGIPVYLEDTKIFSGKAKIRPAGSTDGVWTFMEAVKCN